MKKRMHTDSYRGPQKSWLQHRRHRRRHHSEDAPPRRHARHLLNDFRAEPLLFKYHRFLTWTYQRHR